MMDCMDCGQPIDLSAFPDHVETKNARRCVECTVLAFFLFMAEDKDLMAEVKCLGKFKLTLCPDCGEPWPVTETIRADGSLGCPCQDEATWESLGRGYIAHEPDQTYGAADG